MLKVHVYFNFTRKLYSVKAMEGREKGKVLFHSKDVLLKNCKMKVSEAGRQRVLRTKQKNVHAGITGELLAISPTVDWRNPFDIGYTHRIDNQWREDLIKRGILISYDPYKGDSFYRVEGGVTDKIFEAGTAFFTVRHCNLVKNLSPIAQVFVKE